MLGVWEDTSSDMDGKHFETFKATYWSNFVSAESNFLKIGAEKKNPHNQSKQIIIFQIFQITGQCLTAQNVILGGCAASFFAHMSPTTKDWVFKGHLAGLERK